jgi:hypothetical protein
MMANGAHLEHGYVTAVQAKAHGTRMFKAKLYVEAVKR